MTKITCYLTELPLLLQCGLREQIKKWFYNHAFSIKKSLGETRKRKKGKDDDGEIPPEPQDDEDTLKAHCALIEKECKKKDGAKDYKKIFRLLTATREYRRKWMLGMTAPTRVAITVNTYPCLKKPLMVCSRIFTIIIILKSSIIYRTLFI